MPRLMTLIALILTVGAGAHASDADLQERARRILREVPLIDGHNDTPWQYRKRVDLALDGLDFAGDLSTLEPAMHTDLARLRAGGVGAQFWSVYIPIREQGGRAGDTRTVIEQMDFVKRLTARYPEYLEMAYTADDIERIHRAGKIASLMGMEGGRRERPDPLATLLDVSAGRVRSSGLCPWCRLVHCAPTPRCRVGRRDRCTRAFGRRTRQRAVREYTG